MEFSLALYLLEMWRLNVMICLSAWIGKCGQSERYHSGPDIALWIQGREPSSDASRASSRASEQLQSQQVLETVCEVTEAVPDLID